MEDLVMFGGAYANTRVLVTGHTGFKGCWLSHWLLSLGAEVAGVALAPETRPDLFTILGLADRMRSTIADVRDDAALARAMGEFRPRIVFHLAAQPLVRRSYAEPKRTFDVNVGGTVNLLEAARACDSVRACVVVTSDKCYENREWPHGYRESDALGGHDPYSASKGAAELVVASYRRSFFADGRVRLATARAGNVIGGGDWSPERLVTDFIGAIEARQPLRLRNPRATRPWQHVLEPLSGYLLLGANLLSDQGAVYADAWNFGPRDGNLVAVEELARRLVAAFGAGEIVAQPQAGQPHEAGLLGLDCGKARDRLGWRGVWDIDATVARVVEWHRAHAVRADVRALTSAQISAYVTDAHDAGLAWAERRTARGER